MNPMFPKTLRLTTCAWSLAARYIAAALAMSFLASCSSDNTEEFQAPPVVGTKSLAITPVMQQTEVWCWAAVAEMVFRHYALPNLSQRGYQCGIVAAYYGPSSPCWISCFSCVAPIGTVSQMQVLLNGYGVVANQFAPSRVLTSRLILAPLTFEDLANEINKGRPVVAGISPSGFAYPNLSEHAVLIVGYVNDSQGRRVLVNDPFPYQIYPGRLNPYFAAGGQSLQGGRYQVTYDALIRSLRWANSVSQIQ